MAIILDEARNLITLSTKHTSYQMKIDEWGTLLHTHFGGRLDAETVVGAESAGKGNGAREANACGSGGPLVTDMSTQIVKELRGFSSNPNETGYTDRTYTLDTLPQEYSAFGGGDYRITGLHAENPDGSQVTRLKVKGRTVREGKYSLEGLPAVHAEPDEAQTLSVTLRDDASGLEVELLYGVLDECDVINRAARLTNTGEEPITLQKAASLTLDIPFGAYHWMTFFGHHAHERELSREPIHHGIQAIGSVRGISSHHYNPFSIICSPQANEIAGECYGISFLYSGEFLMEVEKDSMDQTRFICSIHPDNFCWTLEPGQTFTTPEAVLSYSGSGLGALSRQFHRAIREHVCRGPWASKQRPVLINNWEATYFDFTGEKLIQIAKEAKELGIELFVMDDGWYGERSNDDRALGDWAPNEAKLGGPLHELAQSIVDLGLLFGIWVEPESISENSDLFRAHPDWAVTAPGRAPALDRRQLVLDLCRPEVRAYIIENMTELLTNNPISYVKWDLNRSICDKFSPALGSAHQGEFAHRFVLGLYEILETLTQRFPEVLFEGCCGGGGRFDAGMLYYTPQIWTSDNTDAYDRLVIQYGTSFGYPISAMGAHVSAVPNHQTGRSVPLDTRSIVAMAGNFGYELDITRLTEAEKRQIPEQIALFRRFSDLIQYGDYYRLMPADGASGHPIGSASERSAAESYCTVWEMAAVDGSEALVSAVYHDIPSGPSPVHVAIQGLRDDACYEVDVLHREKINDHPTMLTQMFPPSYPDQFMTGAALRNGGLTIPAAIHDGFGWQLHLKIREA